VTPIRPIDTGRSTVALAVVVLMAAAATLLHAQTRYNTGQTIAAAFEGWERNPDGSFNMVFGYLNRNYEEILDIPVGPNNRLEPGDADQGQPTVFFPRRQQFMFKVRVPADWGDKYLIWTLTHRGHTEKAYASLKPFWEIDNDIYHQNRAGPGAWNAPNAGPTMKLLTPAEQTAAVGQPVSLVADVADDGLPAPPAPGQRQQRGGGGVVLPPAPGRAPSDPLAIAPIRQNPISQMIVRLDPDMRLGVIWVLHRRSTSTGNVTFEKQKVAAIEGQAATTARFSEPGVYVLRGYADDGILLDYRDVVVTVK
jgi:hypothetical protein